MDLVCRYFKRAGLSWVASQRLQVLDNLLALAAICPFVV